MIIQNGAIVLEQCGWPGNIGDSAAETGRAAVLGVRGLNLAQFRTDAGYVRHPTAPEGWRESDFSNDQALPLYLGFHGAPFLDLHLRSEMRDRYKGKLVPPGFRFSLDGKLWAAAWAVRVQGWLFALPYRWSDSKRWFERMDSSSADFLNYFVTIVWLHRRGYRVKPRPETMDKIRSYYLVEPNAFIVEYYEKAMQEVSK